MMKAFSWNFSSVIYPREKFIFIVLAKMMIIIITAMIMRMPRIYALFEEISEFKKTYRKTYVCRISIQQSPYLMKMNTLPSKIAFCYFSIRKQIFCKSSFISI